MQALQAQTQHQMQTLIAENQRMAQDMIELRRIADEANATSAAAVAAGGRPDAGSSALVSKWAPSGFSGEEEDWRNFALKFRS